MSYCKMTRLVGLFVPALVCCAPWAGAGTSQYKGCNLLMISITNIGAGHMSLYGYGRKTTPNLDKWAEGALVFEDAFTPAPWTLPVAASVFTSLYPHSHGVLAREGNNTLARGIRTLPELLKAAGYKTAAFAGGLDYMKTAGHMRGFETAPDNPPFTGFSTTTAQATEWLLKNSGGRFFLFLHGYDAHPPFIPSKLSRGVFVSTEAKQAKADPSFAYRGYMEPGAGDMTAYYHIPSAEAGGGKEKKGPPKGKAVLTRADIAYLRDLYDEKILDADASIGRFLDSLGKELLDKTIVVVFSEHGEMFAEHGRLGRGGAHRGTIYDETAHVPLAIKLPGAQTARVRGLVQMIDIMPTLTELLGILVPGRVQGTSLLPLMNEAKPVNEFVYAATTYDPYAPQARSPYGVASLTESVRDAGWKLIREIAVPERKGKAAARAAETFELYDIKRDPGETVNLAASHQDKVKDLARELKEWNGSSRKFMKAAPGTRKISESVLEQARQHGYW